jgi:hypothetical protein
MISRKNPIIDVRSQEEYGEAHILSAQSAPLAGSAYLRSVPGTGRSSSIELARITWPVWPMAFSTKTVTAT